MRTEFNEAYYKRFYDDKQTAVVTEECAYLLVEFLISYMRYIRLFPKTILDVGCGTGRLMPYFRKRSIQYQGIDISKYCCDQGGWERASVGIFDPTRQPSDLVVCQGVLQYLPPYKVEVAFDNLRRWTTMALFLEITVSDDWDRLPEEARKLSDDHIYMRSWEWYKNFLDHWGFVGIGGGLFVPEEHAGKLMAIERTT
jgi:SAM-dependent methyltransferase